MARYPDWFERLDAIREVVRQADRLEWLGRSEIRAVFGVSERDSIRLLHRFGAGERADALSLPRSALVAQLEVIRRGGAYAAYLRQRKGVASQLSAARAEISARRFRVEPPGARQPSLADLPKTISWRRSAPNGPARFEILYGDGADLMRQLAHFLSAACADREEFFTATEAADAGV